MNIIAQGHAVGLDIAVSCGRDDQEQIAVCLDMMVEQELAPEQMAHLCRRPELSWPESVRLVLLYAYRCIYRQIEAPSKHHPFGRVKYEESPQGSCGHVEYSERKTRRLGRCSCNIGRAWDDGLYRADDLQKWALRDNERLQYPAWYRPSKQRPKANRHVLAGRHPTGAELGPEGKRCKDCEHRLYRVMYSKCQKMRRTGSPTTDICQRWRACELWEQRGPRNELGLPME